jgi:hypothetical protein
MPANQLDWRAFLALKANCTELGQTWSASSGLSQANHVDSVILSNAKNQAHRATVQNGMNSAAS